MLGIDIDCVVQYNLDYQMVVQAIYTASNNIMMLLLHHYAFQILQYKCNWIYTTLRTLSQLQRRNMVFLLKELQMLNSVAGTLVMSIQSWKKS